MANEKTPVVWDDTTKKHRPLGTGEKMGGLDASSLLSSDSGNLLEAGSDGLAYLSGSGVVDPRADNLLEESDRGKLQVTVDRIAEWLDGHPQDAALLAEAINVVSGDEGNVITAGSDKGAFLSKGAIAAAVAGMTDAQKAQLADAIAARIASDIADGKTIVASGGKLTSDPTNATAAQKKAINQALADADSGLVVDNSTGKLKVDFSQMPTDKFEDLLKGLKMQIPMTSNLEFHVDTNGAAAGDSIIDGRGTAAKPFKTIQACIDYVTQTYSIGVYHITVKIHPGVYQEQVRLSHFNVTNGYILLEAYDYANPPTITNPGATTFILVVSGQKWRMKRIVVSGTRSASNDGKNHFCYGTTLGSGASLYVTGCRFSESYIGEAPTSGHTFTRIFNLTGASTLEFGHMQTYANELHASKGNGDMFHVMLLGTSSSVVSYSTSTEGERAEVVCDGVYDVFASIGSNSSVTFASGGTYVPHFVVRSGGSVSGKRYSIDTGGGAALADSGTFPGSVDGTVDSATCGWYQGG